MNHGETLLHSAVFGKNKEIVKLLLSYGASPNLGKDYGDTPLHDAARGGSAEIVELLMLGGGDPSLKNIQGKTPMDLAKPEVKLILEKHFRPGGHP